MDTRLIVEVVLGGIMSLGGLSGLVAWVRAPAEKNKITSEAHSKESEAVESLSRAASDLVDSFQVQVKDLREENKDIRARQEADRSAREREREELHRTIASLVADNEALKRRIRELESKIKEV